MPWTSQKHDFYDSIRKPHHGPKGTQARRDAKEAKQLIDRVVSALCVQVAAAALGRHWAMALLGVCVDSMMALRERIKDSVASRHEDPLTDVAVQWPEAMPANVRPHVVAWALAQPVKASSGRRSAGREENPKFIIGERSTLIATQCCNRCSVQRGLGRVGLL